MEQELQEPLGKTRLVAWLTAGLLAAGVVSAGVVSDRNAAEDRRVVAAGQNADGVELPTTLPALLPSVPPPLPPPPPPPTTTVPAPATTAAPTPTTTTTRVPRTTTTKAPATTTTARATTPTTAGQPTSATVNIVNEHPSAVNIQVNGRPFTLAPGQQTGPVVIPRFDHGNDTVSVSLVQDPGCGMGDADGYFSKGGSYRMAIVAAPGMCQGGVPGPAVRATPA